MKQFAPIVLLISQGLCAGTMGAIHDSFSGAYLGLGAGFTTIYNKDEFLTTDPTRL